jgi:Mg2+/Co2+ transporter CorB
LASSDFNNLPISALFGGLLVLLLLSAFFSAAETSMMAINRYRLRHLAATGNHGAKRTVDLLNQTDKLLGVILLGNNLINAASATLVTLLAIRLFGNHNWVLGAATLSVTFVILVFSEITPKVIGAAWPEKIAFPSSLILRPLLTLVYPVVWFVNLFVQGLLRLMRLTPQRANNENILGIEELRTLVLESGKLMPGSHNRLLLNLLDLENSTVNDIMIPRNQIELLNIQDNEDVLTRQITGSHHGKLPVINGQINDIVGILHVRSVTRDLFNHGIDAATLREHIQPTYFIPPTTPLFTQLRQFQQNRQHLALVVDEYGELTGLITLNDILEEIVGELDLDTHTPSPGYVAQEDGSWLIEGSRNIRQINRRLHLDFPESGPRTLNGLILEQLEDIPEAGTSLKIAGYPVEIVQVQERMVKTARIFPHHTTTPNQTHQIGQQNNPE